MHYKYLRSTNLKFKVTSLGFINQLLTELSTHENSAKKQKGKKQEPTSPKQQMQNLVEPSSDDFMLSTLQFVPSDYKLLASSLQSQISSSLEKLDKQDEDETMSIPDEEEKGENKLESIETVAKEMISKLKLVECFVKAIDRLTSLCISEKPEEFLLCLNSSLF